MGNVCSAMCSSKDDDDDPVNTSSQNQVKSNGGREKSSNKNQASNGYRINVLPEMETGSTPAKKTKINKGSTGNSSQKNLEQKSQFSTKGISIKDFEFLKYVGKGSYGKVALVKKISNRHFYAMKILKKKDFNVKNTVENALTEKEVLMKSKHPFVVRLRYSFQDNTCLYFCLDYVPGGELFKYLKQRGKFDVAQARFYAAEVLLALGYLHDVLDTIYRDLKPENILVDEDGHIKLTDFGLSKSKNYAVYPFLVGTKTSYSFCGTPEYLAPEIILNLGHTKIVDFWTFGCLIYEMLIGKPPFSHANQNILFTRIKSASFSLPDDLDEDAKSLIRQLLVSNPKERLGIGGTAQVKNHPFFQKIDFDKLTRKEISAPIIPKINQVDDSDQSKFIFRPTPSDRNQDKIQGITYLPDSESFTMRKQDSMRGY